jgi:hypothetical protein
MGDKIAFNDVHMFLGALLKAIAVRVKSFEGEISPGIHIFCRQLEEAGLELPDEIADVYREFLLTVKRNCLERANLLFQLGDVLTPTGRFEARNELCPWVNGPAEVLPTQDAYREPSSSTASDVDESGFDGPAEIGAMQESDQEVLDVGEDIGDADEPRLVDIDAELDEDCQEPEHEESHISDQANPVHGASDDRLPGAL